jgi:hypothetical protein
MRRGHLEILSKNDTPSGTRYFRDKANDDERQESKLSFLGCPLTMLDELSSRLAATTGILDP